MAERESGKAEAQTATEPRARDSQPLGETLGRYRIEKELGEGAMGVVHAAFDPELERRVALKVLRNLDGNGDARQRLLREARAMARLSHPNVAVVHEVGTADGRDYVAMELFDGGSLHDWLHAEKRSQREVIEAFRGAARGLAAAHRAGLVHRDFKPHNVLRSSEGRVCVTDFGLARGVEASTSSLETTLRLGKRPAAPAMPSRPGATPLPTITATGSVVGTPAYMAPEQWTGEPVGPPADQFSYCIAVWEALTGERPFRAATIDAQAHAVAAGPDGLDTSALPRRLRPILLRGLDPDPKKRWPSMDALLAALDRAQPRPWIAIAAGGVAMLAAGILFAAAHRKHDTCAPPLLDPDRVFPGQRVAELTAAHQGYGANAVATDLATWRTTRVGACKAESTTRPAKLACLDGVLANLDVQARALALVHAANVEVGVSLIDPRVCEASRPPRLTTTASPTQVAVAAAVLEQTAAASELSSTDADRIVESAGTDACAIGVARVLAMTTRLTTIERRRDLDEAASAAQRCGDDRLVAAVAYANAEAAMRDNELDVAAKMASAAAAAENVMQPDARAALDELRAKIAERNALVDDAISLRDSASAGYHARGRLRQELRVDVAAETLRQQRGRPEDITASAHRLDQWYALARQTFGDHDALVTQLAGAVGDWKFSLGDVAGSHAIALATVRREPIAHPVRVTGRVVDTHGGPAAGAAVVACRQLVADSIGIEPHADCTDTKTAADGTFQLPEAVDDGYVLAYAGTDRARPVKVAGHVELALEPTAHIDGTVELHGTAPTNLAVFAYDPADASQSLEVVAPVQADGTFSLDGVPRGKMTLRLQAQSRGDAVFTSKAIDVTSDLHGIRLDSPATKRVLHVIVRSTASMALTRAAVFVIAGHSAPATVADLNPGMPYLQQRNALAIDAKTIPPAVLAQTKLGDVYAEVHNAPDGDATVCAVGLPAEVHDPELQAKVEKHKDRIALRCASIAPGDSVVTIEVAPWPRLD